MTDAQPGTMTVPDASTDVSTLLLRPADSRAVLVLAHGAGAGMRHPFLEGVAQELADRGIATLRYQFPYMQAGKPRPDRQPVLVATVRAAVEVAGAEKLPLLAGGKSMGGRMTSLAASEAPLPGVVGIAFVGFPLHAPASPGNERAAHLADVTVPMLFLQGTRDSLARLDLLEPVIAGLGASATLHIVDGGDHSFVVPKGLGRSPAEVRAELADTIAAWAGPLL